MCNKIIKIQVRLNNQDVYRELSLNLGQINQARNKDIDTLCRHLINDVYGNVYSFYVSHIEWQWDNSLAETLK